MADPDRLYYDGRCPLCSAEMRKLGKLAGNSLRLIDIHAPGAPTDAWRPGQDQLLRRLHLQRSDGTWLVGLAANVRAWQHTRYGWLWRPLLWQGIRPLARYCYERWAARRYERLYGDCTSGCGISPRQP